MARILVVDDNEDIRAITHRHLTKAGHLVLSASDGQEALDILAQESVDVLVCDIIMPTMSGTELVRRIREQPEVADVSVLILTARGDDEHLQTAFAVGADEYMMKPFTSLQLTERVDSLLIRRESVPRRKPAQ